MTTTIDNRVIQMKFDNDEFEKRASKTFNTLDTLKSKMNFAGAAKGLTDLNAASKNFTLEGIGRGVDELKNKFSALSIVGITALTNIANRAVNAGAQVVKSLTIGPISEGFNDYNTKLTSVQTIMNATGATIQTVNKYFDQLDTYADKTIYNLTDMTSAFAKFTNAGIPMEKAIPAIKGIANMTALAGQGADAAQIAYYNLSQSLSGGFLTTIDYKSLNLANIATVDWKNHMIEGAIAAGTLKKGTKGMYTIPGVKDSFNMQTLFTEGLQHQWASAQVLTKVLGDYGNVQTAIGKKAQAAAQNVKSLPMMMDTLKASVGTGWTDSFQYIFGNVEESTKLFTGATNAIQKVLDKSSFARNHMLHQWKDLGGRTAIIDAISNAWKALGAVLKPIGDAWREIFPPGAGKTLADLSFKIREFTKHLMIGGDTAQRIKSTFEGVFSIFKIGILIVKNLLRAFFGVFGTINQGSGGILAITAIVGEFIRKIYDLLNSTDAIDKFFSLFLAPLGLIKPFIALVSGLAGAFGSLFMGDVSGFTSRFNDAFTAFGDAFKAIGDRMNDTFNFIGSIFSGISGFLANIGVAAEKSGNSFVAAWATRLSAVAGAISGFSETVRQFVSNLIGYFTEGTSQGQKFLSGFGSGTMNGVLTIITALVDKFHELRDAMDIGGQFSKIASGASAAKDGLSQMSAVGPGTVTAVSGIGSALSGIAGFFEPVLTGLRDFFTTVVSKVTGWIKDMDFQDALAVVNTSFLILLYRSIKNVASSIAGSFNQLTATLKSMQQDVKANVILKIAIAVGVLVTSLVALSRIDPKALGIALGALTAVFVELGAALKFMNFDQKGLLRSGAGMILLATSIRILVSAVEVLAKLKLSQIIQGVTTLGIMMAMLVASATAMETALPGARAIVIIAAALAVLTPVLITLGLVPLNVLAQGLGVIAAALLILGAAANMMTAALPGASAILIIAGALAILTPAIIAFGLMPWQNIAKAGVVVAGMLTMLVIAANAMTAALPGAAAILILAGALAILAPALVMFGMMSWGAIAKGLTMLAITFAIFVAAMYALTPVIAVLSLFSGSLLVMGAGLALAGAGMLMFSAALAALAVSGAAGFLVLIAGIHSFLAMLPLIAQQFGLALVALAVVLGNAAPKLIEAFVKIIMAMLKGLQKLIPEFVKTMGIALMALVTEIARRVPQIAQAGLDMILALLKAIRSRIGDITNTAIDIVVKFINTLAKRTPDLVNAGGNLMLSFMNSLANWVRDHNNEIGQAGWNIISAVIDGMWRGVTGLGHRVADMAKELADRLPWWVRRTLGISSPSKVFMKIGEYVNEGFAVGLMGSKDQVVDAMGHVNELITTAKDSAVKNVTDLNAKLAKLNHERLMDDKAITAQQAVLREAQNRSISDEMHGKALSEAQRKAFDADKAKDIQTAKDKLDKLIYSRNQDVTAIRNTKAALIEATLELNHANAAQAELNKNQNQHVAELQTLSTQYDDYKTKIDEANKSLEDMVKTRDDYANTVRNQYDALPDVSKDTSLTSYIDDLEKKVVDTHEFATAIQQLRDLGLNDEVYKELISKGPESMPFVQALLDGGEASVTEINNLEAQLATEASNLGVETAGALYDAGVRSAQGLVAGLQSEQGAIYAQMQAIAAGMVSAIQEALQIKSPSRVFMKMGVFSAEGLAKGLRDTSSVVESSAKYVGNSMTSALQKTLSDMATQVPMNMDLQPKITPILDLSNVQKGAAQLGTLLPSQQIDLQSAYARARAANAGYAANQEVPSDISVDDRPVGDVVFNQTINSPKPVSPAEVYRNTNNVISKAKGVLTGATPSGSN